MFSEPRARRDGGGGRGGYILLDVWSEPKGPPLQGHNAIKHSKMKCLIGGDKGGRRGGRGGKEERKIQKWKLELHPGRGWRRWLGGGQEMHEGYSGCGAWVCDSLESRSRPSQTACGQMTNTIINEWLGRTTSSPSHRERVNPRNVEHWNSKAWPFLSCTKTRQTVESPGIEMCLWVLCSTWSAGLLHGTHGFTTLSWASQSPAFIFLTPL